MNDLGSPPVDEGRCPAAARIVVSVLLGISCLAVQPRTTWAQTLRQPNQSTNSVGSKFLEFAGMVFPRGESRTRSVDPKSGQSQDQAGHLLTESEESEELLPSQVAAEDPESVETMAAHDADRGPLAKVLSPDESKRVVLAIRDTLGTQLRTRRDHLRKEFTLENEEGALSRFVSELAENQQQVSKGLQDKIDAVVKEFFRDQEDQESQQRVQLALARMAVRLEDVALSTKDGVESKVADLVQAKAEPQKIADVAQHTGDAAEPVNDGDSAIELDPQSAAPGAEVAVEAGEVAKPLQDSIASDCIQEYSEALGGPDAVEPADRVRLARHQTSTLLAGPVPAPPVPGEPAAGGKLDMDLLEDKSPFYVETDHSACTTEVEHRPIGSLGTNIVCSEGVLPPDCARAKFEPAGEAWDDTTPLRNWMQVAYPWEASYLCHRPLYFEEINLERLGYMNCDHRCGGIPAAVVQPVLSGAHFFATVPILPYKMVVEPPCKCIYALGHYRPGSPVPYRINRIPLRPTAGVVETAVIAGTVLAFP